MCPCFKEKCTTFQGEHFERMMFIIYIHTYIYIYTYIYYILITCTQSGDCASESYGKNTVFFITMKECARQIC